MVMYYYKDTFQDPPERRLMVTAVGNDAVDTLTHIASLIPSNTRVINNEDVGLRMSLTLDQPWSLNKVKAMGAKRLGCTKAYALHEELTRRWALIVLNQAIFLFEPPNKLTKRYILNVTQPSLRNWFRDLCVLEGVQNNNLAFLGKQARPRKHKKGRNPPGGKSRPHTLPVPAKFDQYSTKTNIKGKKGRVNQTTRKKWENWIDGK